MWSTVLEHCILFSSVAALTGPPGSASYTAANAVLDGHAATFLAQGMLLLCVLVWKGLGGALGQVLRVLAANSMLS